MIWAVGMGPGDLALLTPEAREALERADVVVGYRPYLELLGDLAPPERREGSGMKREVERCRRALELHRQGRRVAVVSSGDAGIYGMAGLLIELDPTAEVQVIPGITACQAAAARLGAPLMNDFAVLSLSDLLTPREEVLRRVEAVAAADLVTCLYNPSSRRRRPLFEQALAAFLRHRGPETRVAWVRNVYRQGEESWIGTLGELPDQEIDMWTLVLIGSKNTELLGGSLVTRRGYREKYLEPAENPEAANPEETEEPAESASVGTPAPAAAGTETVAEAGTGPNQRLYVLGGTGFARHLTEELETAGWQVRLSVASELGAREVETPPGGGVHVGGLDGEGLARELERWRPLALVDATHPYAEKASATAAEAAGRAGLRVLRAARRPWRPPAGADRSERVRFYPNTESLIRALLEEGHVPFLTVGTKLLPEFVGRGLDPAVRVLASPESVASALRAGIPPERLLAAYPPFDPEFTAACLERYGCDVLVSKESGTEGGLDEKLTAAELANARLAVLTRPPEPAVVYREAGDLIEELERLKKQPNEETR